jgi:repressor LexA
VELLEAQPEALPNGQHELGHKDGSVVSTTFTQRQGEYLAFIYYYAKVNGRPPAESDIQRYFGVTAPTVHQMIVALEAAKLIQRRPGMPRSIKVLVPRADLPDLA